MAPDNEKSSTGASWAWAALTPFLLAAAACTGIGLFFLPALCVYLDRRSRTYSGAITMAAGMALAAYLFGAPALAISSCVVITTAAAYILCRVKIPFPTGLAGSAAGGVLGMMAMLAVFGTAAGAPLNEVVASLPLGWLAAAGNGDSQLYLDLSVYYIKSSGQLNLFALFSNNGIVIPSEILSMPAADKLAIVKTAFDTAAAVSMPALALSGGLLMGALGYWLPQLAYARFAGKASALPDTALPPFAAFKVPKYIVISLLLVQIVASITTTSDSVNIGWLTVQIAAQMALSLLMVVQAISLFSFLLNRKGIVTGLQILIFIPAVLLLSWLLYWVGIFDALFDMRTVLPKIEEVRARGKQVFTQNGLEELRKMQESKRNGKKGKDGEDGKK